MASRLMDKVGEVQVGKKVKAASAPLITNVKEIKDAKEAAAEAIAQVRVGTKDVLHKIEKKRG